MLKCLCTVFNCCQYFIPSTHNLFTWMWRPFQLICFLNMSLTSVISWHSTFFLATITASLFVSPCLCISSPCCVADSSCLSSPAGQQEAAADSGPPPDAGEMSVTERSYSLLHLTLPLPSLSLLLLLQLTDLFSCLSLAWGSWWPKYVVFAWGRREV